MAGSPIPVKTEFEHPQQERGFPNVPTRRMAALPARRPAAVRASPGLRHSRLEAAALGKSLLEKSAAQGNETAKAELLKLASNSSTQPSATQTNGASVQKGLILCHLRFCSPLLY